MTEISPPAPGLPADGPEIADAVSAAPTQMSPRDRTAVAVLLATTFVVILNETIMGVALPRLMADLCLTAAAAQWLTTAFMLTMAVVIPVTGFLLQRVTTRAAFRAAMGLFSLGTLVAALAPGFVVLVDRPGRPGLGHGDHAPAADDDGDDRDATGHPRPHDGQHLGGHLRRPGDRSDHLRADPHRGTVARAVRRGAAGRAAGPGAGALAPEVDR